MTNLLFILFPIFAIIFLLYLRNIFLVSAIPRKIEKARLLLDKESDKSISLLNNILKIDKSNPIANWLLGNIHFQKHRFILSLMFYRDIIKYNRFNHEVTEENVRSRIAQIYLILGNIEKALTQFNILSEKGVLSDKLYKRAINIQLETGHIKSAKELIRKALLTYKQDGEFYYYRAKANYLMKNFSVARLDLEKAQKKYFLDAECCLLLGKLYFINKEYEKALNQFKQIPKGYLESHELESLLGQTYYHLDNPDSAITLLESILEEVKPDDEHINDIRYFLACSYEVNGNIDRALELWSEIGVEYAYYSNTKEKLDFYNEVAISKDIRNFLTNDFNAFKLVSETLIASMDFSISEPYFFDTKNVQYICCNKRDMYIFIKHFVAINRNTTKIDENFIRNLTKHQNLSKSQSLVLIAPSFDDSAITYSENKNITLYNLDIFKKYNLIS